MTVPERDKPELGDAASVMCVYTCVMLCLWNQTKQLIILIELLSPRQTENSRKNEVPYQYHRVAQLTILDQLNS